MTLVALLVAGAFGAGARYLLTIEIGERWPSRFPSATLTINVMASLLLGLLAGAADAGTIGSDWRTVLGLGFLGAFSTFSTLAFESADLIARGEWQTSGLYLVCSVVLACAAAAVGLAVTGSL